MRLGPVLQRRVSPERLLSSAAAHLLSLCLLVSDVPNGGLLPPPAHAGQPLLTVEQKLSAEAWKVTDKEFVDRSFAGVDWFSLRGKLLKATTDTTRDETYDEIRTMLAALDDKYTRLLTCLLYTSPSPRDRQKSRMPSSA